MAQKRCSLDFNFEKRLNYSRVLVDNHWIFVSGYSCFDYSDMTISDRMAEQVGARFPSFRSGGESLTPDVGAIYSKRFYGRS